MNSTGGIPPNDTVFETIRSAVPTVEAEVVRHYRHLHRHPELSWREFETAAYVERALEQMGYTTRRLAGTGIVVDVETDSETGAEGPRRVLRADMDAIATHESTGLSYASATPGIMHGCGHDAHTAILLGAARLLRELDLPRPRPLRLLFQPAEEVVPSGSMRMIEEGALDGASEIFTFHVWPDLSTGMLGIREGVTTAAADVFEVELLGPGGHGARPHQTVDLISLGARIVTVLVDIPRTRLDPLRQPAVVSVGAIHGGESLNVIPSELRLGGTVRTIDPSARPLFPPMMEEAVRNISRRAGAEYRFDYRPGPPALVNDLELVRLARGVAFGLLGPAAVGDIEFPSMGSEDFAHFTEKVPGALLRLGCTAPGDDGSPLHSSRFRVDEAALPIGVGLLAALAHF